MEFMCTKFVVFKQLVFLMEVPLIKKIYENRYFAWMIKTNLYCKIRRYAKNRYENCEANWNIFTFHCTQIYAIKFIILFLSCVEIFQFRSVWMIYKINIWQKLVTRLSNNMFSLFLLIFTVKYDLIFN